MIGTFSAGPVGIFSVAQQPGVTVDGQRAVHLCVQREVDARHPRRHDGRQGHSHQLQQHAGTRERCVQQPRETRAAPPGGQDAGHLGQVLQQRGAARAAHRESVGPLGGSDLRAGRVLAVQAAHTQLDAHRPATGRHVGERAYTAAVPPVAGAATARAPGRAASRVPALTITAGPVVSTGTTLAPVKCGSTEGGSRTRNERMPGAGQCALFVPVVISGYGNPAGAGQVVTPARGLHLLARPAIGAA